MKSRTTKIIVISLVGVMGISIPMTALASNPEFARTAEEWEKLRDNVLEYEEIADLIQEYNVTVQNNQYEYNKFIQDYGRTREDIADEYRELADDLESSMSGEEGLGMVSDFQLQLQADELREQADDTLEDSRIYYLNYKQAEDNLVLSAQAKFLSYYRSQLELESAKAELESLENQYALIQIQRQAGAAMDTDVLDAEEAVMEQEKEISELEQKIENTRQTLIVMCGWKGNDHPEISDVPELDLSEIEEIDLEADIQTAVDKNYTLQINKRKLENALNADNRENIQKNIESNERQIRVSVTNSRQSLETAKNAYELAVSNQKTEERNMSLISQKWNAGMITKYEYEEEEIKLNTSRNAVQTAYLDLIEAWETYQWNIKGLASAE